MALNPNILFDSPPKMLVVGRYGITAKWNVGTGSGIGSSLSDEIIRVVPPFAWRPLVYISQWRPSTMIDLSPLMVWFGRTYALLTKKMLVHDSALLGRLKERTFLSVFVPRNFEKQHISSVLCVAQSWNMPPQSGTLISRKRLTNWKESKERALDS